MKRKIVTALAVLAALTCARADAAGVEKVKIGILNDMSSILSTGGGKGSVVAAQLAVEDFLKSHPDAGFEVEIISADHQNKADVGSAVARKWFESENVDAVIDLPNSSVALAVSEVAKQFDKVAVVAGAGTTRLTRDLCNANTVHWAWDTYATASGAVSAAAGPGADKWFIIAADYAFGVDLKDNAVHQLEALGHTVTGTVNHPFNNADYSSFLLQALDSGANVVAFANAGGDFTTAAKQAAEFGLIKQGVKVAALWGSTIELTGLGLEVGQGLNFVVPFYWDANDRTRALHERFAAHIDNDLISPETAGVYSGTLGFLRGIHKAKTRDGSDIVAAIKTLEFDDVFGKGHVRGDGRKIHEMHLYRAKTPAESKGRWDLMEFVKTIPADKAFAPPSKECSLVK